LISKKFRQMNMKPVPLCDEKFFAVFGFYLR